MNGCRHATAARLLRSAAAIGLIAAMPAAAQTLPINEASTPLPQRPKWEAGVAAVAFRVTDYPASDEYRKLVLPVPYFVYHGRVLRSDDQGSRMRRKLSPFAEIDVSGGGALASDSSDSQARDGMPDLGYLVELGPNLRLSVAGWSARARFMVNLPVRGVVSIGDPGLNWRGVVFAPELAYRHEHILGTELTLRVSVASQFVTDALGDYFYAVEPRYATAGRPAYAASGGYLGSSAGLRIDHKISNRVRLFTTLRYYDYTGAANEDSPLFRSDHGYSAGLGVSWTFLQSREPAEPE